MQKHQIVVFENFLYVEKFEKERQVLNELFVVTSR
jgi:hypothetical protein